MKYRISMDYSYILLHNFALSLYPGIILAQGSLWKEQRRYVLRNIRNCVKGQFGQHTMENIVGHEARHLVDDLKNTSGTPYNPRGLVQRCVTNIIAGFVFGHQFEHDDPFLLHIMSSASAVMEIAGPNNPALLFKPLRYIPGDPFKYFKVCTLYYWGNKELWRSFKRHEAVLFWIIHERILEYFLVPVAHLTRFATVSCRQRATL